MRYIANPIYDAVFKFMMEDIDVAKRFIGIIINKKIVDLKLLPQERTMQKDELPIRIQRLDFVAEVKEENGNLTKVLIEIQKSNKSYHADLLRFRGYLAKNYEIDDLPIITIYILGFKLDDLECPVLYVHREYIDAFSEQKIAFKSEFVEKLTHNSYVIQVPRLKLVLKSKLSQLLEIFNQSYRVSSNKEGSKILKIEEEIIEDADVKKVLERLEKACANKEIQERLADEEYLELVYEEMFGKQDREILELKSMVEEKDKELEEKDKELEEKDKELEEKDKKLEEEKKKAEEAYNKVKELARLLKSLGLEVKEISQRTGLSEQEIKEL